MNLFIEILQLVGTLLAVFIVLLITCVIQSHILTKEESENHADFHFLIHIDELYLRNSNHYWFYFDTSLFFLN